VGLLFVLFFFFFLAPTETGAVIVGGGGPGEGCFLGRGCWEVTDEDEGAVVVAWAEGGAGDVGEEDEDETLM